MMQKFLLLVLLMTIPILSQPLPYWEVANPMSKVFVMDKIPPTAGSLAAGNSSVPNAYLVDPAIDTLLLMMEMQGVFFYKTTSHPNGIVGSNDVVILKGNFQWEFRNTTSTDRIKGVIWRVLNHPNGFTGEILVGDNTQWASIGEDDNNSEDTNQSILDVVNTFHAKGYPVHLFRWADIMYNVVTEYSDGNYNDGYTYEPMSKITYPKFQSPQGNYVSLKYGIWNVATQTYNHDRLCLIDFPVLKAHGLWEGGATLAIKNWMGVLTAAYQNERYGGYGGFHEYMFSPYALVAKVMQVTFPRLTIIDGAWCNPEGNQSPTAVQRKMLAGSTDPFAVDWYAAKYMLTPVAWYPQATNPDNVGGTYYNNFTNWINCMHDSGFAVTKDPTKMSVYSRTNALPVELTSFTGIVKNNQVLLEWETATEISNYGFEVERSIDNSEWNKIGFVPGNGNSNSPKFYSFLDENISGGQVFRYRLKQIDTDGDFEYSNIIEVDILVNNYSLEQNYPNPFNASTTIEFSIPERGTVQIKIYDVLGNELSTLLDKFLEAGVYEATLDGSTYSSGIFMYQLRAGSFMQTKKLIIIK